MAIAARQSAGFPMRRAQWRRSRGARILLIALAIAGCALLLLRFLVSPLLTSVVNNRLEALPEYSGHVSRVQLALWRGNIDLKDFSLWQRGHEREGPVLQVRSAALSLRWASLFRGELGGEAKVDGAHVTIVKDTRAEEGKTEEEKERAKQQRLGEVRRWQTVLQEGFPIALSRFELVNSEVKFRDVTEQPNPELTLTRLRVLVTGLDRRADAENPLPATAVVSGVLSGNGRLEASARADPFAPRPRFTARLEIKDLNVPDLAAFMRAYAQAEVKKGTFEVFMEAEAKDGRYQGYVKPFFRDLEFKAVRGENESALKFMAVQAASAVQDALKNEEQKVATKAPFEGNFADNQVDVWTTIENLLRNAFVQALREGLEGQ